MMNYNNPTSRQNIKVSSTSVLQDQLNKLVLRQNHVLHALIRLDDVLLEEVVHLLVHALTGGDALAVRFGVVLNLIQDIKSYTQVVGTTIIKLNKKEKKLN